MRNPGLTVVKIGGSHAGAAHLRPWLDALAGCGGRAIIVPGGGPFADAVRVAQAQIGFSDAAAHEMALYAMAQFGLVLCDMQPALRMASSRAEMRRVIASGLMPVWAPAEMALRAKDIPASWDVTSDSLAAWLAGCVGAKRLLLVKHGTFTDAASASALAARGVVDPLFPRFLAAGGAQGFIATPDDHAQAAAALRDGGAPGVPILLQGERVAQFEASWPRSKRRVGAGP